MIPVLWKIPGLGWSLPGYGVALMIGFLLSIWWAARRGLRSGANPDVVLNCGFIALIGGVVGSRVMYVWHYWDQFARRSDLIWSLIDVRQGGLEVYGGVLVVVISVFIYLRRWGHSTRWYLDIMAPSAALGMGIGRIGCFLNGCCWGTVCDLPWAVGFPYGSSAERQQWVDRRAGAALPQELIFEYPGGMFPDGTSAQPISREVLNWDVSAADVATAQARVDKLVADLNAARAQPGDTARIKALERQRLSAEAKFFEIRTQMKRYGLTFEQLRDLAKQYRSLPVHPTQLYSTITLVLLAFVLNALYWRRSFDGQVICTFLLIEPLTRFVLEFLRPDNPVDVFGVLTISQAIALPSSALGLIGLLWLRTRPARSPRARRWEPPPEETPQAAPAGASRR